MKLPVLSSVFSCVVSLPSAIVVIQQTKPKTELEAYTLHRVVNIEYMSFHAESFCVFLVFQSEMCVISELEDLSASVDVQDVYTKIKCKVGIFNIDHYRCRWSVLHTLNTFTFSCFFSFLILKYMSINDNVTPAQAVNK